MSSSHFDLIVIGGGITGAGIALDATARGLKVALVEMQDFAAGTSSRSTKLIHGGLRYLKQLEFKLVAEVGKERAIVHKNAPHLTKPEYLLLPIITDGSLTKFTARLGMTIYEWLAGVKKQEKHRVLNKMQTMAAEPLLRSDNLLGGILFYEYRTDDARLTIEVLKEAVSRGALAINYMKAESFIYSDAKITGLKISDQLHDQTVELKANYIVNATGPWIDEVDIIDKPQNQDKLHITKGIHIVVDGNRLPLKQSSYFDTFDKRMIFIIPREGKTYIGTTDTSYSGDLINPNVTIEDVTYLLKCVNAVFPTVQLVNSDIKSSWAGLRPLIQKPGKGPSEISRKDEIFESESGLITIAGGKLTGYRKMAQRIVDLIAKKNKGVNAKNIKDCSTHNIILSGGNVLKESFPNLLIRAQATGITEIEVEMLLNRYGSNIDSVLSMMEKLKETSSNINREGEEMQIPLLLIAQLHYCIENEMCFSPSDFFIRRTGALYFDIETVILWEKQIVLYMKNILNWNEQLTSKFCADLTLAIKQAAIAE